MNQLQFIALITTAASSFVLVILAWLQSNVRTSRVESLLDTVAQRQAADMKEIRDRLTTIDNHLMTFYTVTGRLEGRIDELSRK